MHLRPEQPSDIDQIRDLTTHAFAGHPHSDGSEPDIIDRLREAGALSLSLVALEGGQLVGHVAVSPVEWDGGVGWFGLGPVSVEPTRQRHGIGTALIQQALQHLEVTNAGGCVVLGDPAYYRRFGFHADGRWTYPGLPPESFLARPFAPVTGSGEVRYHPAFSPDQA